MWIIKGACNENNKLEQKNEIINKKAVWIIWKCRNLSYLAKRFKNEFIKDKTYCKVRGNCHYMSLYRGI